MPFLTKGAPKARSNKKPAASRQQRLEQHKQNEEVRPEDQRLLTRIDLENGVGRFFARSTMLGYATSIHCFSEFCEDVLHFPEGTGGR